MSAQKVERRPGREYGSRGIGVAEEERMAAKNGKISLGVLMDLDLPVGSLPSERTPPTKPGGMDRHAVSTGSDKT